MVKSLDRYMSIGTSRLFCLNPTQKILEFNATVDLSGAFKSFPINALHSFKFHFLGENQSLPSPDSFHHSGWWTLFISHRKVFQYRVARKYCPPIHVQVFIGFLGSFHWRDRFGPLAAICLPLTYRIPIYMNLLEQIQMWMAVNSAAYKY